jgi:four helix bundle protein
MNGYIELKDLNAYKHARTCSRLAWGIYQQFDWETRKVVGHQMIRSADSVGANIAEGYGRFHYLDKNKFYYNARGSLLEVQHWFGLMRERGNIDQEQFDELTTITSNIGKCLNGLITVQFRRHKNT